MKERLERILISLAHRYAPRLIPASWNKPGDYPHPLPDLARALAEHNVLVLLGDVPVPHTGEAAVHVKLWADTYMRLYQMLAQVLFPSFTECNTYYADQSWPPVIILQGAATPLIMVLAGYIAPFIAARQVSTPISDVELRGLLDMVLDELEADDLPRNDYRRLRDEAVGLVKDLLALHVRQMPLTPPARAVLGVTAPPPPVEAPPTLPEADAPSNAPAPPSVPVFFERKPKGNNRRPPVPKLPDDADE